MRKKAKLMAFFRRHRFALGCAFMTEAGLDAYWKLDYSGTKYGAKRLLTPMSMKC